jgi:hypothetical protein
VGDAAADDVISSHKDFGLYNFSLVVNEELETYAHGMMMDASVDVSH